MLRAFQVNVGTYLTLNHDILPTSKVAELCSSIEAVSGEKGDSQVLLTADGRQMDPRDLIGNYSVGTEDKPLFVFYRSYISTSDPPVIHSRLPPKESLQKQLEILRQRPSPTLFQRQVALSKHLCEYSVEVGRLCEVLAEEYTLQLSGWRTVLSNCSNIIGMFQKHHQLFCKAVEKFRQERPHHLELLQQFPEQVKLLQQLPTPSPSTHKSTSTSSSSSLYDWISTHDEKNSLMDLSTECKKALAKVDGEQLETALRSSDEINSKTSEIFGSEDKSLEATGVEVRSECSEVRGLLETIKGLSKNIQLTSDKAFRSGDAKTIAMLVESQHKSLQLMASHSSQLEAIARRGEEGRKSLTCHVHARLKLVMQLQKTVADSNGQLVLLHEHIKLACRRFEILEQVCSTPQVLVEVSSEVGRRRSYNVALEKVMEETVSRLHRAREEEKRLRRSFQSSHGVHFVTSLFPELQDRVPDITFHSPKSLSKTYEDNLEAILSLLPQSMRPSTQLASSIQLLVQPTPSEASSELSQVDTTSSLTSHSHGSSFKLLNADSTLTKSSGEGAAVLTENTRDDETLKELVGKLELANVELSSKLQKALQDKKTLQADLAEKESAHLGAAQKLKELEELVLSLRSTMSDLEASKVSSEGEKLQLVEELKQKSSESAEGLARASQELQDMTEKCEQLRTEREEALAATKLSAERLEKASLELQEVSERLTAEREKAVADGEELSRRLQHDHAQTVSRLQEDCAHLRDTLIQTKTHQEKELLALQVLLSQTTSEKQLLSQANEELQAKEHAHEGRLSEMQEAWGLERQSLERELTRLQEEQKLQRETLVKHSSVSGELSAARGELQERERALEACKTELDSLRRERESVRSEMQGMREELGRQKQRSQQAQATMNSNRAQLEAIDAKRKELSTKLEAKEAERARVSVELQQTTLLLSKLQEELSVLKRRHSAELKGLEERLRGESERLRTAEQKAQELENTLNQKGPQIDNLEKKLASAKARISELEEELSKKKEKLLGVQERLEQTEKELYSVRSERDRLRMGLQASSEDKSKQKDELDHRMQESQAKLERALREHEAKKAEWSTERDGYIVQVMELEREVKELRRDLGPTSPASTPPTKHAIQRMSSSEVGVASAVRQSGPGAIPNHVTLFSLQVGDVGLFMTDQYGNYLALSLDAKTYYLDVESAKILPDLNTYMPHLTNRKRILVGRVTERLCMEVRKENNRLRVPVGSRLYKLQAEQVPV